jgi:hypothetical protein
MPFFRSGLEFLKDIQKLFTVGHLYLVHEVAGKLATTKTIIYFVLHGTLKHRTGHSQHLLDLVQSLLSLRVCPGYTTSTNLQHAADIAVYATSAGHFITSIYFLKGDGTLNAVLTGIVGNVNRLFAISWQIKEHILSSRAHS